MHFTIKSKARSVDFHLETGPGYYVEPTVMQGLQRGCGYEPEIVQVLLRALRPGDLCVDVGANVGYFTAIMSQLVGEKGTVIAVEPEEKLLPTLKRTAWLNGTHNVTIVEQPLWHSECEVEFWHSKDSMGAGALWNPGLWWENPRTREKPSSTRMQATTLDKLVGDREVRLIKIDCEGAEYNILNAATSVLFRQSYIIVELNRFGSEQLGASVVQLRTYMSNYGYDLFLLHENGALPTLVPLKTEIAHYGGYAVMNALFSTREAVADLWPTTPEWKE